MALSNAAGKSWAPGGTVFLLGLPWGVLVGLRKLLFFDGVEGREFESADLSLPDWKKFDMKLAIASV